MTWTLPSKVVQLARELQGAYLSRAGIASVLSWPVPLMWVLGISTALTNVLQYTVPNMQAFYVLLVSEEECAWHLYVDFVF